MQLSTPEQKRVEMFIRIADRDIETAESLMRHSPQLYENIGSSCQQAVKE